MTVAHIALALVMILAVIVAILNAKSNALHDKHSSSITTLNAKIYNDCSSIATDLSAKQQATEEKIGHLQNRVNTLEFALDSLSRENAQLRKELDEQRRKLNFYANIEDAAESLTVKENSESRTKAIEAISEKIVASKRASETSYNHKRDSNYTDSLQTKYLNSSRESNQVSFEHEKNSERLSPTDKGLDKEQDFARYYMDNTSENVFITGKAGTGKSFLLDVFKLTTCKANIILAPTGIAALNVKGATLHSVFGYYNLVNLDVNDITEETIRLKREKKDVLKRVSTIIIDEISMVRADTFDKIDRILKCINRTDLPFGGKQMLVFGDLFQLPPIVRGQEYEYLFDKYGGVFFFHSNAYKEGNFKFIELTENHRQNGDEKFFSILNRIREGKTTEEDISLLNTRYTPTETVYDRFIALLPTKSEVERINRNHMDKLESLEYVFKAKTLLDKNPNKNRSVESIFPVSEELRLRLV